MEAPEVNEVEDDGRVVDVLVREVPYECVLTRPSAHQKHLKR